MDADAEVRAAAEGIVRCRLVAIEVERVGGGVRLLVAVRAGEAEHDARVLLDGLLCEPRLAGYAPLHAADAELHVRAGEHAAARAAYERAIAATGNAVERAELQRRLAASVAS